MESKLFEISAQNYKRIAIVGDIHGDYRALSALLKIINTTEDLLVFLGDYADRGSFGVESIREINSLTKAYPQNVIALKGNHEDFSEDGTPNFRPCTIIEEAEHKIGSWSTFFQKELKPFIEGLYIAAVLPNEVLLVHGGISSKLSSIKDLMSPSRVLEQDILWSDPFDGKGERRNQTRGLGVEFGMDITLDVCEKIGVKKIIRSHQPKKARSEPSYTHQGKVVTVHSTTVYGGIPFVYFIDSLDAKDSYCGI
jgi:hypothetical protein